jgi:hypothetical protein
MAWKAEEVVPVDRSRARSRGLAGAFALLLVVVLLGGCEEPATVEIHEPGIYKGSPDPLLEKARNPEFGEKLRERLKMIQTDR